MQTLAEFLIWYLVFVFSTTCHEAAHAFVAFRGGDDTAYALGQVTLDPTPHIRREPIGMVLMPIISFFTAGWTIGWASTPYNPYWGARHPKRRALMSLAGPSANFLLALIAVLIIRGLAGAGVFGLNGGLAVAAGHSAVLEPVARLLFVMVELNLLLGVFNLIPIPPLDGAAVVEGFAPSPVRAVYDRFYQNPGLRIAGLVISWWVFRQLAGPLFEVMRFALQP